MRWRYRRSGVAAGGGTVDRGVGAAVANGDGGPSCVAVTSIVGRLPGRGETRPFERIDFCGVDGGSMIGTWPSSSSSGLRDVCGSS